MGLKHIAVIIGAVVAALYINQQFVPADYKLATPDVMTSIKQVAVLGAIVAGVMFALHKVGV